MNDLAIVILNYNGSEDTIECLESLKNSKTEYNYNIFLLDNGSNMEQLKVISQYVSEKNDYKVIAYDDFSGEDFAENCFIISEENWGFAGGNNRIVNKIYDRFKFILLLNNDTIVTEDFIQIMLEYLNKNSDVGFASCRINNYYDKSLLWNCGGKLYSWGVRKYYSENYLKVSRDVINAEFITGCALFVRNKIIKEYGFLTYDFFHGEEDFNFCWRMKKHKIKGICINRPLVFHKVSASSKESGIAPGKIVGYYANRIIDMKKFYNRFIWIMWREILIFVMSIKWKMMGIPFQQIVKMVGILRRASRKDKMTKETTLNIWNMTF